MLKFKYFPGDNKNVEMLEKGDPSMRKAVVSGANGFVGSWLVKELLKHDVEVIAILRNEQSDTRFLADEVRRVYCEMKDFSQLIRLIPDRDIDVFYHLAWSRSKDQENSITLQEANTSATMDAAVIAKQLNVRKLIVPGTIGELGVNKILDQKRINDEEQFAIAKHSAHLKTDELCAKIGLPYVWARFCEIYGPHSATQSNIVGYVLNEFHNGKTPTVYQSNQPYDLMFIRDATRALYLLGDENTLESCYYVGSGEPRVLKSYLESILQQFGKDCSIGMGFNPEISNHYNMEWMDISSIKKDVGFTTYFSFDEGIELTRKWPQPLKSDSETVSN